MAGNSRTGRPQVAILGGGFAGVGAAKRLAGADADVLLVDRHDYHTFQPLLYQLATGMVETSAVGHSLGDLLSHQRNATVQRGTVAAVDLASREVHFDDLAPISYDYLVYALGAQVDFHGIPGTANRAFPIYTLADAIRLRHHLWTRWRSAERGPAHIRDGALNIVIVGGGPTGVEAAGALAELYRDRLSRDYPDVAAVEARVVLVETGSRVLSSFAPALQTYAEEALADRMVDVRTGHTVASVAPTHVTLASGEVIPAHTLVWGGGTRGNPVARALGVELAPADRIRTDATLTLPGHPEVFVVGDAAAITVGSSTIPLPQLATVALQSGRHAGAEIGRRIRAEKSTLFTYLDKGIMATVGRGEACVQLPDGGTVTGRRAQLAWLTVHMALLPTNGVRSRALVDWVAPQ